jgi:hypothetical protein
MGCSSSGTEAPLIEAEDLFHWLYKLKDILWTFCTLVWKTGICRI